MNEVSFFTIESTLANNLMTKFGSNNLLELTTSWVIWEIGYSLEDLMNSKF